MRILGEVPLRKFDPAGKPIVDPEGNPDTSFLAKIPADTPFTFQLVDKDDQLFDPELVLLGHPPDAVDDRGDDQFLNV